MTRVQRLRSVDRGHRVRGASHFTIVEARGLVRGGRPVLRVPLTFTRCLAAPRVALRPNDGRPRKPIHAPDPEPSLRQCGTDARDYIESYTRTRFTLHLAQHEPGGPGSGGTIVSVLTGGDVIQDLETFIQDTMRSLFFDNQLLELEDWLQRWKAADSDA